MDAYAQALTETKSGGDSMPLTRKRYFIHGLLPQLMAFEACIRLGSVTAAARELRLAQPSVSCLLRKACITFGGRLAVRQGRRMKPTDLGERVLMLTGDLLTVFSRFDSRDRARDPSSARGGTPMQVQRVAQRAGLEERAPM